VEPKYRDQVPKVAFMDGVFMVYEPDGKFIPKGEIQSRPPEGCATNLWVGIDRCFFLAYDLNGILAFRE